MHKLNREADNILREILGGFPEFRVTSKWVVSGGCDLAVAAVSKKARFRFCVQAKSRITPQTAISVRQQLQGLPEGTIAVIYSPTISPRVAQILREQGIGYVDRVGNWAWFKTACFWVTNRTFHVAALWRLKNACTHVITSWKIVGSRASPASGDVLGR